MPKASKLQAAIVAASRKRRRKLSTFPEPRKVPDAPYRMALLTIAREAIDIIKREVIPAVERIPTASHADADVDVDSLIGRIRIALGKRFSKAKVAKIVERNGGKISKLGEDEFLRQMKGVLGIDLGASTKLAPVMKSFVKENVDLITSIPEQLLGDVETIIRKGVTAGVRSESLIGDIVSRFGVTERRASLIARDQTSKLVAQVAHTRQQEIGVKRFTWRTARDERVRGRPDGKYPNAIPSHWDRDGKVYRYDDPPDGEMPGDPVNCRCRAEPVLKDVLAELGI
jgi:SPP1 gp7 family putative phage head morphogenesis protein